MNEKIKLLKQQAGIDFNPDQEGLDQFAELIIQECAKEADKQNIFCRGVPWGNWVKKHFGVEE